MAKLVSRVSQTLGHLSTQGRVRSLSYEETSTIDRALAAKMKDIKSDYELKEKKSRAYIANLELTSLSR